MKAARRPRRPGILGAAVVACSGIVVLIGLGLWQLERKVWKEALIESATARIAAPPVGLPPPEQWPQLNAEKDEFRHVTFSAEMLSGEEALVYSAGSALRPDVTGPGYWVFSPARLLGGSVIVVNRGFVPLDRKNPDTRPQGALTGVVDFVGALRWPERRGPFTPSDEPINNIWFLRDPVLMATAKKWGAIAPFYVEQEQPRPPGDLPRAGALSVRLTNNHLQYALTWFALAAGLAGVFLVWLKGQRRRS